jgi:hypothetical protein
MVFPQLPLTVTHAAFEPASSLISRLAARNGADSVQQFCGDIAFPLDALFRGEAIAVTQLAQLAGCDAASLQKLSIRHLGRSYFRLRDEIATTHTLHRTQVRVCPICIRNEAPSAALAWRVPRRLQWKFLSIRSCPQHRCALVSLPPEKFTKDGRDFTAQIRKHFDWIARQKPVRAESNEFEDYLTTRLLKGRGDAWIDELELNVVSRACEILGLLIGVGSEAKLTGHTQTEWARFGQQGYAGHCQVVGPIVVDPI